MHKKIISIFFSVVTLFMLVAFMLILYVRMYPLKFMETTARSIQRVSSFALVVYKVGNTDASIAAVKQAISEISSLGKASREDKRIRSFADFQLGLMHARLFKLYKATKNQEFAASEFELSRSFLKSVKLDTEEDLEIFIDQYDNNYN